MNLKKKFILISKINQNFNFLSNGNVKRKSGINFSGKKTCRNRGFISKRKIKTVDYFRAFWHIKFFVLSFCYDFNRNTLINLIQYSNQSFSYIISIENVKVNSILFNGNYSNVKFGISTLVKNVSKGAKVSNLESYLYSGSKLLRSSAMFGKILSKGSKNCTIIFKNKKTKKINKFSSIVIGSVLNFNYSLNKYKKASFYRFKGLKPKVRGVAMNPVDHPHGGGEGKKSKKKNPTSPWGKKLNFVKR